MNKQRFLGRQRQRREFRVRNQLRGDAERPRLSVFRSHNHIACQVVDDDAGKTLVSASTRDKTLREQFAKAGNCAAAKALGKLLAERALAAGIAKVRFDRGHYKYHGRVAALAEGAREGGLSF